MYIYPVNKTIVTAPDNFEFICNTNIDINVILLIDGMAANSTKFDRIRTMNKTTAKDTVYQYTFMNTISTDNGTTFRCLANNKRNQFQSDLLTLQVYCEFMCLSVCLCVCLSVYVSVCLCVCMHACVCVLCYTECLCVCLSVSVCMCISEYLCTTIYLSGCQSARHIVFVCEIQK